MSQTKIDKADKDIEVGYSLMNVDCPKSEKKWSNLECVRLCELLGSEWTGSSKTLSNDFTPMRGEGHRSYYNSHGKSSSKRLCYVNPNLDVSKLEVSKIDFSDYAKVATPRVKQRLFKVPEEVPAMQKSLSAKRRSVVNKDTVVSKKVGNPSKRVSKSNFKGLGVKPIVETTGVPNRAPVRPRTVDSQSTPKITLHHTTDRTDRNHKGQASKISRPYTANPTQSSGHSYQNSGNPRRSIMKAPEKILNNDKQNHVTNHPKVTSTVSKAKDDNSLISCSSMEDKLALIIEKLINIETKFSQFSCDMTDLKATVSEFKFSKNKMSIGSLTDFSIDTSDSAVQTDTITIDNTLNTVSTQSLEYFSCRSCVQSEIISNVLKPFEDIIVHAVPEGDSLRSKSDINSVYERSAEKIDSELTKNEDSCEKIDQYIQCDNVVIDFNAGGEKIICASEAQYQSRMLDQEIQCSFSPYKIKPTDSLISDIKNITITEEISEKISTEDITTNEQSTQKEEIVSNESIQMEDTTGRYSEKQSIIQELLECSSAKSETEIKSNQTETEIEEKTSLKTDVMSEKSEISGRSIISEKVVIPKNENLNILVRPETVAIEIPQSEKSLEEVVVVTNSEEETVIAIENFSTSTKSSAEKLALPNFKLVDHSLNVSLQENKENISPKKQASITSSKTVAVQSSNFNVKDRTTITDVHNVNRCLFLTEKENKTASCATPESDVISEFDESICTPFKPKSIQWLLAGNSDSDAETPLKVTPSYLVESSSDNSLTSFDPMSKTLDTYNKLREDNFLLCTPKNVRNIKFLLTPSDKLSTKQIFSRKVQEQLFSLNNTCTSEKSTQSLKDN